MPVGEQKLDESFSSGNDSEELLKSIKPRTIFERVKVIYTRDENSFLSHKCFSYLISEGLLDMLKNGKRNMEENNLIKVSIDDDIAWEFRKEGYWVGIITNDLEYTDFELSFIKLLLSTSRVNFPIQNENNQNITSLIAELFVKDLKNTTEYDEWQFGGSDYFKSVVDFFTSRNTAIQAVLPAFPCKSSNLEKVSGPLPDRGEQMALQKLITFARKVKEIYKPGIKLWIVSDGHVFSDCIAVDDDQVNVYSSALKNLYQTLKSDDEDPIQFSSLVDIFSLNNSLFKETTLKDIQIGHYLDTKIDEEAEICRKILVTSCDTDSGSLMRDINTPKHPRLYLYRGFSRFMTEDLEFHPIATKLSRKKFKKIISKVAFEMIKRNDAYSNLVELFFPFCLRLSIHAHKNCGPKFGIKLLDSNNCLVINSLEDHKAPILTDLLHIPTPWHNSIVEIDDKKVLYAIKSGHIKNGLEQGKGSGGWNLEKMCFELKNLKLN
ncbi:uncharacterized protein CANTADRAFT_21328 [Suhomyces tanzawaensis NRRL Y-17324]|uniref:Spore wall maturation protein DIT1 n=1 Tax=Suhomyces tanzawaensis NRRL Y-17324 TaxID=984487 RepID=A0A1E4SKN8_9ASCO|nr:uncharacterized protein CANTADRAFT_21328 [Suhomyces tanzawaensis NRRL Y-17324]ODV80071.1 hypothetical protein CANTADRAFT_21328 [Suhomyces tanzawaensis NRRL Y-17324]